MERDFSLRLRALGTGLHCSSYTFFQPGHPPSLYLTVSDVTLVSPPW